MKGKCSFADQTNVNLAQSKSANDKHLVISSTEAA